MILKRKYKASIEEPTLEEQILLADHESLFGGVVDRTRNFEKALKYDITRCVLNIFSNTTITYNGRTDFFTDSFQRHLSDIFFTLHENGRCYLKFNELGGISDVSALKIGAVEIIDLSYKISNITQKQAANKAMELFGVAADCQFTTLNERGVMGIISPQKGVEVKNSAKGSFQHLINKAFGARGNQYKIAAVDMPMQYSQVTIPVKDLDILENKKEAIANVARIDGIQEDMILSGSTFDNTHQAIIQTYSDFKGVIYGWINQIESQLITLKSAQLYTVDFTGLPNIDQTKTI